MMNVVDFARQILAMDRRIQTLEAEVERLTPFEEKYDALIQRGIEHSHNLIGGLMQLATTPGVMDAIAKHNESGSHAEAPVR
jgi:hypothetical protein